MGCLLALQETDCLVNMTETKNNIHACSCNHGNMYNKSSDEHLYILWSLFAMKCFLLKSYSSTKDLQAYMYK